MTTEVNRKDRKLPVHWTSRIPKHYKKNSIRSDLNRELRISSSLKEEISKIRQKFLNADYLLRFINSVIKQSNEKLSETSNEEDDYILPPNLFAKRVILIEVPYCEKNETSSKCFLKTFHEPSNNFYETQIKWIIKKMRNSHPACTIYEEICTCKENYYVLVNAFLRRFTNPVIIFMKPK